MPVNNFAFSGGIKQYVLTSTAQDFNSSLSASFNDTPTSGNLLVLMWATDTWNQGGADDSTVASLPTGFTSQLQEAVPDNYSRVGIATKTSDGTESGALTLATTDGGQTEMLLVELEAGWELDVTASDSTDAGGGFSAATGALTAGDHLALSMSFYRANFVAPVTDSIDRFLVDNYYREHWLDVGVTDIGTATTAHTFSGDQSGAFDDMLVVGAVFYKAGGGGASPQTWTGGAVSVSVTAASGTFVSSGGPQTWTATAVSINATASTEAFSPGVVTWTANAASINATVNTGSFTSISDIIPQNLRLDISQGSGDGKSASSIWLLWDAVAGATGYDVRRNGSIVASNVAVTNYEDSGLSPDTEYTHEVRARFT